MRLSGVSTDPPIQSPEPSDFLRRADALAARTARCQHEAAPDRPSATSPGEETTMGPNTDENRPAATPEPTGIVVGRDLMFTAKVTGTAGDLGYRMRVAGDVATARTLIEQLRPRLILVDLTAGDPAAPEALGAYRSLAGPSTWLVGVGPHVDTERLAAARAAGCDLALPRSKFSADLPALLRRCFETPPADA
jgi:hypothetical protein